MGSYDLQRGDTPDSEQTATEASFLQQNGDMRSEEKTKILEAMGLSDFAGLCYSHIDQFADFDDLYDIVGDEAMDITIMNPNELPGGSDYEFRGSASIADDFRKRADWERVHKLIGQSPVARLGGIERETLRRYGISKKQIDEFILTDEEIMQGMQQQQMMDPPQLSGGNYKPVQQPTTQNPRG